MARLRTWLPLWSVALGLLLVLAGASGAAAQGAKAPAKLDLNTASEADIEALKGVGADTAKKIVAGRPYEGTDVAKALDKAGVSKSLIPKIAGNFTIGTGGAAAGAAAATGASGAGTGSGGAAGSGGTAASKSTAKAAPKPAAGAAAKLDLNSASEADIEALKGVGSATAKKIVAGRPYEGTDVAKALDKAGVSKSLIPKIAGNFTIGTGGAAAGAAAATGASGAGAGGGSKSSTVGGGTAATPPATGGGSSTPAKSTTAAKAAPSEEVPARTPPQKGQVWVNTDSGVFHKEGTRWYGKTKEGKWMTEADAVKAGYRAAKNE